MGSRIDFNSHHAPIGAFASFTLGFPGSKGGLGLELAGPADEPVYVGLERDGEPGHYDCLPFFDPGETDISAEFDVEGLSGFHRNSSLHAFEEKAVRRHFGPSVDEWVAGDLTLSVISPVVPIPDPSEGDCELLKRALVPAVHIELTVDNRAGTSTRKAFLGYSGSDRSSAMRLIADGGLIGIGQNTATAICTLDQDVYAGIGFQPEAVLNPRHPSSLTSTLGPVGMLVATVQPGELRTFRFAVCFFREGQATTGLATRYLYRRWFNSIEDVARFALTSDIARDLACGFDERVLAGLSEARGWMLTQAIRSYYGSTQCLETAEGEVIWVVNEGEYRMMNTLDLTIDQMFFELALNLWTVRNELDFFARRYSYEDQVRDPSSGQLYPGGITFCHDQGVGNNFSPAGHSSYEQAGLTGCFSYMSCEELLNWMLLAATYVQVTGDQDWAERNQLLLKRTLASLVSRDNPDPTLRNGFMGLDSSRCEGGAEITTYDSLDTSLGQARESTYIGAKCWAAYSLYAPLLHNLGLAQEAALAASQAELAVQTLLGCVTRDGTLPALIDESGGARIVPIIEGFIYLSAVGLPVDPRLLQILSVHLRTVLDSGQCRFESGGWKLSSTSRNSWLSKIYLCQAVAEQVLGFQPDHHADEAHQFWLLDPQNTYFAWSDQMVDGKAAGSKYYPRGVTAALWLNGGTGPLIPGIAAVLNPQP